MTSKLHTESIESLTAEIERYQSELDRLRSNLAELQSAKSIDFPDESPANLHDTYREHQSTAASMTREIEALKQAIEHGAVILEEKRDRLTTAQSAVEQEQRAVRVATARAAIETHAVKVEKLSKQLEAEMQGLKSIFDESNVDFRQAQIIAKSEGGGNVLQNLIEFRYCAVPTLQPDGDRFILTQRAADLFAADKWTVQQRIAAASQSRESRRVNAALEYAAEQAAIELEKQQRAIEIELQEKRLHLQFLERQISDGDRLGLDVRQLRSAVEHTKLELAAIEQPYSETAA